MFALAIGPARIAVHQPVIAARQVSSCYRSQQPRFYRDTLSGLRMQGPVIDNDSMSFYDEYRRVDPKTGDSQPISFQEKEKLYLECLDAYYNEGGKQLLPDDEYEQLKNDLNFEGRRATQPRLDCIAPVPYSSVASLRGCGASA